MNICHQAPDKFLRDTQPFIASLNLPKVGARWLQSKEWPWEFSLSTVRTWKSFAWRAGHSDFRMMAKRHACFFKGFAEKERTTIEGSVYWSLLVG